MKEVQAKFVGGSWDGVTRWVDRDKKELHMPRRISSEESPEAYITLGDPQPIDDERYELREITQGEHLVGFEAVFVA